MLQRGAERRNSQPDLRVSCVGTAGREKGKKRKPTEREKPNNFSRSNNELVKKRKARGAPGTRGSCSALNGPRSRTAREAAGVPARHRGRRKPCEDHRRLSSFLLCFSIQPAATQWSETEVKNATTLHEKDIRNALKLGTSARCRHGPSLRSKWGNGAQPKPFKQSSWKTCLPGVWNRNSRATEKRDSPPPSSPAPAAPRSRQKTRRAVGKEHFVANFNYPTRRLTDRRD